MKNHIVTSKGDPVLSGGQALILFVIIFCLKWIFRLGVFPFLSLLVWIFVFVKRPLKIDVANRSLKDGPIRKWEVLPEDGYISVLQKLDVRTKKLDSDSLKLLWVTDSETFHIYSPQSVEEGEAMALYLAEQWDCRVYKAFGKVWLR